jgi:hypothetical protein
MPRLVVSSGPSLIDTGPAMLMNGTRYLAEILLRSDSVIDSDIEVKLTTKFLLMMG